MPIQSSTRATTTASRFSELTDVGSESGSLSEQGLTDFGAQLSSLITSNFSSDADNSDSKGPAVNVSPEPKTAANVVKIPAARVAGRPSKQQSQPTPTSVTKRTVPSAAQFLAQFAPISATPERSVQQSIPGTTPAAKKQSYSPLSDPVMTNWTSSPVAKEPPAGQVTKLSIHNEPAVPESNVTPVQSRPTLTSSSPYETVNSLPVLPEASLQVPNISRATQTTQSSSNTEQIPFARAQESVVARSGPQIRDGSTEVSSALTNLSVSSKSSPNPVTTNVARTVASPVETASEPRQSATSGGPSSQKPSENSPESTLPATQTPWPSDPSRPQLQLRSVQPTLSTTRAANESQALPPSAVGSVESGGPSYIAPHNEAVVGVPAMDASTPVAKSGNLASLRVDLTDGQTAQATVLERSGSVEVKVMTSTAQSAQHVGTEMENLRQSLSTEGLTLVKAEVNYQNDRQNRSQYSDQSSPPPSKDRVGGEIFTINEVNE